MSESGVANFTCKACGAQLKIPNNPRGNVYCEYCGAENYITSVVKNAEIKKKNDVNSGIPLFLNEAKIHRILMRELAKNVYSSWDMFQKIEVLKVEKCTVPAYYIFCNGTLNFAYEQGVVKERQKMVRRGNENVIVNEKYTEWLPYQSSISESRGFFIPANQEWSDLTQKFYQNLNPSLLVDIERLEYPADTVGFENDLPVASSVNKYIMPTMKELLATKAKDSLRGRQFRNLTSNGENIQKDTETRVLLSFYWVKFEYEKKLYHAYITNNGELIDCEPLPEDAVRVSAIRTKQTELKNAKPKNGLWIAITVACAVLTIALLGVIGPWVLLFPIPGIGVATYFNIKKIKENNIVKAGIQAELDAMMDTIPRMYRQRVAERQALPGVLEHLSGNAEAFFEN